MQRKSKYRQLWMLTFFYFSLKFYVLIRLCTSTCLINTSKDPRFSWLNFNSLLMEISRTSFLIVFHGWQFKWWTLTQSEVWYAIHTPVKILRKFCPFLKKLENFFLKWEFLLKLAKIVKKKVGEKDKIFSAF